MPRIFGLETEYALLYEPAAQEKGPDPLTLYTLLETALKSHYRVLPACRLKGGLFLENGGAMHFETGLVEMATPECHSARQAMLYQAANDRILQQLAPEVTEELHRQGFPGRLVIGKNNVDSKGTTYGTHENYSVIDPAPPGRLVLAALSLLRGVFLVAERGLIVVAILFGLISLLVGLLGLSLWGLVWGTIGLLPIFRGAWKLLPSWGSMDGAIQSWIQSFAAVLEAIFRVIIAVPFFLASRLVRRHVLVRPSRELMSHLLTRPIWCGAGRIHEGAWELMQRSAYMRPAVDLWNDAGLRPIIDLKHILLSRGPLHEERCRLHVTYSDSNMSQLCTWLKLGTTGLLLDMLEAGESFADLLLKDPQTLVRSVSQDAGFHKRYLLESGREMSAIQIQREFQRRAARFHGENDEVVQAWGQLLDGLETAPALLYRDVDWAIKRSLMQPVWPEQKQTCQVIDLKYHDLEQGYYRQLARAGKVRELLAEEEIETACRQAPPQTRAAQRGAAVAQYADQARPRVYVTWDHLRHGLLGRRHSLGELLP